MLAYHDEKYARIFHTQIYHVFICNMKINLKTEPFKEIEFFLQMN